MIRRTKLLRSFLVVLCVVTVLVLLTMNHQPAAKAVRHPRQPQQELLSKPRLPPKEDKLTLFHLDLKGAPPRMEYLLEVVPLARQAGANGLLVEYEDMFPWSGPLRNISAGNAYSREEVQALVELARKLQMEVIPLVQTFGHLEFVLKLEEFRHLRELDPFPQEVCPSNEDSFLLIKEMIAQMMEVHEGVKYLHIGCDEVYHIGACPLCSTRDPRSVFSSHVRKVGQHVRNTYPGVTPIIWDDMLRTWPPYVIEEAGLGDVVEPMVWVYIDDIPRLVPHFIWFVYKKTFPKVWAASAFKGAFGEKEVLPDMARHMDNNLAWQRLMAPLATESTVMHREDFRGIALTGWSRYDHFAVLAELLPLALPSLILNLALTHAYNTGLRGPRAESAAFQNMIEILRCPDPFPFHTLEEMRSEKLQWVFGRCHYPGSQLFPLIAEFFTLQDRLGLVLKTRESNGWVSEYNERYNFSSPYRVLELFSEEGFAAQRLARATQQYSEGLSEKLSLFYDEYTVREWVEQKLGPIKIKLKLMEKSFQALVEMKTWPRRPLVPAGT